MEGFRVCGTLPPGRKTLQGGGDNIVVAPLSMGLANLLLKYCSIFYSRFMYLQIYNPKTTFKKVITTFTLINIFLNLKGNNLLI